MDEILAGGIVTIVIVGGILALAITTYVFTIIYSLHVMQAGTAMQASDNREVAAAGSNVRTMGIVALIASILGAGLIGVIIARIAANATDPELYEEEDDTEGKLTPEEVEELTPLERIRARREGLIAESKPVDIDDMRNDPAFRNSIICLAVSLGVAILVGALSCTVAQTALEEATDANTYYEQLSDDTSGSSTYSDSSSSTYLDQTYTYGESTDSTSSGESTGYVYGEDTSTSTTTPTTDSSTTTAPTTTDTPTTDTTQGGGSATYTSPDQTQQEPGQPQ